MNQQPTKISRGKLYQTEIDQDIRQRSRTRIAAKVKIATSILTTLQLDGNQPHPIGKTNECVYFNYMISSLYLNLELPLSLSTCISLLCSSATGGLSCYLNNKVFTYDLCVNNYHDLSCSDCFQEHGQSVFQFHLTVCDLKAIHFRF